MDGWMASYGSLEGIINLIVLLKKIKVQYQHQYYHNDKDEQDPPLSERKVEYKV